MRERRDPSSAVPRARSRKAFWAFVAAIAVAVAGGGTIVLLARRSLAERSGGPETIAPARAAGSSTPTSTPTPTPTPTSNSTSNSNSTSAPAR